MGVAEVERFEGVGRGVLGLPWLWKCVEKSKVPPLKKRGKGETIEERAA